MPCHGVPLNPALLAAARSGAPYAPSDLIRSLDTTLRAWMRAAVRPQSPSDDDLQEARLAAWRAIAHGAVTRENAWLAYVRTSVIRAVRRYRRPERRRLESVGLSTELALPAAGLSIEAAVCGIEVAEHLLDLLRMALSARDYALVRLCCAGTPQREVARLRGCSQATVSRALARARGALASFHGGGQCA